ncbi:MAG: RNA polymerase sigma factor [Planctomycetes bacterium]|nr:RNA polymerase sigma factor [Planctomycetota bacterium]
MLQLSSGQDLLRSGAPAAWDALVAAARPAALLVAIEHRMSDSLRAHTTPEDVLQDALLRAWRDRAGFEWRGVRAFRAWLLTIIDHRIKDLVSARNTLKRGGGRIGVSLDAPADDTSAGVPHAVLVSTTPSRIALYREQAACMREALAQVHPDLRDVVRLRLFEQASPDRIASELGIGVAAVRHRLRRGAEEYESALSRLLSIRSRA